MNSNNRFVRSNTPATNFTRRKLAMAVASQLLWVGQAIAGPTGGQVVGGQGSIEQAGRETTIRQQSDRLALDWQTFDVGMDERVNFVQPGQNSVALNRILGSNGSRIQGQINANGHVILVNPNGIIFSENATVNAGGLIASGLQINPNDFINGDLVFEGLEGTDGSVINSGILNAAVSGSVALLGKRVENEGSISAELVADNTWTMTADDNNRLNDSINYSNIERLQGSEQNDTFTFEQNAESPCTLPVVMVMTRARTSATCCGPC